MRVLKRRLLQVVGVFEQYLRYDVDTNVAVEYKDVVSLIRLI